MDIKQDFSAQLQTLTLDSLKEMGRWIEGSKEFVLEQAPLFAQEYVKWYAIEALKTAAICLLFIPILIWGAMKARTICMQYEDNCSAYNQGLGLTGAIVSVLACFGLVLALSGLAISRVADACKAYWAPRVVLVEGIRDLVAPKTQGR